MDKMIKGMVADLRSIGIVLTKAQQEILEACLTQCYLQGKIDVLEERLKIKK